MRSTKLVSGGYRAPQPAHLQVRKTIEIINSMAGDHDIRYYSNTARKELVIVGDVSVVGKDGQSVIGVAPKLALVVNSSEFLD